MPTTAQREEVYGGPEHGGFSGGLAYDEAEHGNLLPCPFCGSDELEVCNTHTPYYWVACECSAEIHGDYDPDRYRLDTEDEFRRVHETALQSAVDMWNKRV
ncbi:MAG: Lar family restriction alleviation protein [Armatimonadetes bacterium]|nr:Lar family restriction alleviation protein [Armatimonadota bacterium]